MAFQPVTHVLFDMDGLILNTEVLYTQAYQNVVSPFGKNYTFDIKLKLMGLQATESARMLLKELELPLSVEEFMSETRKQFEVLFQDCKVLPGAKELIEHLHKNNIPIALATSSTEASFDLKTRKHHSELFSLFSPRVCGSSDPEVKHGKPSPDIFLVTASRFPDNPQPGKCLVFEDSVNGVQAARAAGMQVVMVPDPRTPEHLKTDATLVLDSLEQFKPELFGLPPFQ